MAKKQRTNNHKPVAGDLVLVKWEDIAGGESGTHESPVFITPGYYVGWKKKNGRRYLHMHRSELESGSPDFNVGWDCYPEGVVLEVKKA